MYDPQNLKISVEMGKKIIISGQWNYMGEVSRLPIASPRPIPMETSFYLFYFLF